jgi:hypothetical protein
MVGTSFAQAGGVACVSEELCVAREVAGRSSVEEEEEVAGTRLVLEEEEAAGMSSARGLGEGDDEVTPNIRTRIRTPLESIVSLRIDVDGTHGEKHEASVSARGFY